RQGDTGALVKGDTTNAATAHARRVTRDRPPACPCFAHRQRERLEGEGGGNRARLRHAHRARPGTTTPFPIPAREGGICCRGGRERHAGAFVKGGTTGGPTGDP